MPGSAVLFSTGSRPGVITESHQKKPRRPKKRRKGHVLVGRTTCPKCNKTLAYSSVTPHMIRFHPSSPKVTFSCPHHGCDMEFDSRTRLYRHRIAVHRHRSDTRIYEVYRNPRYSPPPFLPPSNRYCPECRKTFPSRPRFLRHKKDCRKVHGEAVDDDRPPVDRPRTSRPLQKEELEAESPVITSVRSRKTPTLREFEKSQIAVGRHEGYGTLLRLICL